MREPKLIAGKMNALYIKVKTGYAEGVRRPAKAVKPKPLNVVTKLRKLEFKAS